jgi:hypothetical protein
MPRNGVTDGVTDDVTNGVSNSVSNGTPSRPVPRPAPEESARGVSKPQHEARGAADTSSLDEVAEDDPAWLEWLDELDLSSDEIERRAA